MPIVNMNRKVIQDIVYWDNRLSWATAAFFIGSVANASLKTILPIPDSLWTLMSAGVGLVIFLIFASCFREMLRRSSIIFWKSLFLFVCIYFISAVLITMREEPLRQMIVGTAFLTFAWWIPAGVYAASVRDKKILYNVWVKASYVISAFAIAMYFFHIPDERQADGSEYNMTFGFYIILPLLFQINEYINKKRVWLLALIIFEIFTIIVYANRGILLSLIFFGIYKFAFESDNRVRKIVSILFLVFFTIAMLSSIENIAKALVAVLDSFNFQSRSLEMLATGVVSDTSGRDELWEISFKMIEQSPILGWGLGGEYVHIGAAFAGVRPEEVLATSFNPHNGIIQNFVCFGLIGGFLATVIVLFPLMHLKKYRDSSTHNLILIHLSSSIIPICISSAGFFTNPSVAICLYLFYYGRRNK